MQTLMSIGIKTPMPSFIILLEKTLPIFTACFGQPCLKAQVSENRLL
jgi:hypothetical protein